MPLLCKLCGRFWKLTIGPWWPKSKKKGNFLDPGSKIKAVPYPGSHSTPLFKVVFLLMAVKLVLQGLMTKIVGIKLQPLLKISLNPVFRGSQKQAQSGGDSNASSVGNWVTSLRIVEKLPEVVTKHFLVKWRKVMMIFPCMMMLHVKRLVVTWKRKWVFHL
ncbi:hypothetical protein RHGRI_026641 [Rhododendron griersonianum]|uniref:Uncharacterized protein n=1 Tax=Rhododendron griersonianum TaxID=479676 RepID=A0AAV6IXY7_9ERIC|nr:hypothetical protein RHGRI_026641 [Rhododendron griersonianum]